MIAGTIAQIAGVIVLFLMIIFIIKNYVKRFIQCNTPYKNVLLLIFCIILSLGSIYYSALGTDLKDTTLTLIRERDNLGPASIAKLEHDIFIFQRVLIVLSIFLASIFIWFCIIYSSVKKEIKELLDNPNRRWNWDKIR